MTLLIAVTKIPDKGQLFQGWVWLTVQQIKIYHWHCPKRVPRYNTACSTSYVHPAGLLDRDTN